MDGACTEGVRNVFVLFFVDMTLGTLALFVLENASFVLFSAFRLQNSKLFSSQIPPEPCSLLETANLGCSLENVVNFGKLFMLPARNPLI